MTEYSGVNIDYDEFVSKHPEVVKKPIKFTTIEQEMKNSYSITNKPKKNLYLPTINLKKKISPYQYVDITYEYIVNKYDLTSTCLCYLNEIYIGNIVREDFTEDIYLQSVFVFYATNIDLKEIFKDLNISGLTISECQKELTNRLISIFYFTKPWKIPKL